MMLRTQWYPFQDLRSTQEERARIQMNRLFAHALGLHGQGQGATRASTPAAWAPALDIAERKDAYLVTVELPGVKADDLDITMEDGLWHCCIWRSLPSTSSTRALNALVDAQD